MKKEEKRFILILIGISIIIITVLYFITHKPEEKPEIEPSNNSNIQEQQGTKTVTSEKLNQTKKIDGIDITNISITEINGLAQVSANVTNTTSTEKAEFSIKIKMLDKNGTVLQELRALVGKTKPGETRQILASVDMDITQVQDIKIEK